MRARPGPMRRGWAVGPPVFRFAVGLLLLGAPACSGAPDPGPDAEGGAHADDAEALRARAAELLPEVEALSGLAARGPVALGIRSRSALEAFLVKQLERQLPPARAEAVTRTYARLGLVPEDLALEPLLRELLLEQVVGYYDAARDTLWVVAGVDAALVETVLVHELVHALQDQAQDLDSLLVANLERNDRATAAQAALEGHATLAMLEWQLARLSGGAFDLEDLPDLTALDGGTLMETAGLGMPALASAPRIIRESLLFPYLGGLRFALERRRAPGDRSPPLGASMPETTEQVLHPAKSVGPGLDRPVALRLPDPPGPGWREVHADGLGEFELRLWLEEHLEDAPGAARAAAGWDGDGYRLLEGPDGEALVWVTAWDTRTDAEEFATAARRALARRYPEGDRFVRVRRDETSGVATVTILDGPPGIAVHELGSAARAEIGGTP